VKAINEAARDRVTRHRALVLMLVSFILANPAILYILTKSLLITVLFPLCVAIVILWMWSNTKSRLAKIYALNLVAIVSVFVHAETVFRTCFGNYIIEDLYTIKDGYYFNKPNLRRHFSDREYSADYFTNCQGYRIGASQDPQKTLEKADWLFIGDSFTQGAQVEFEDLYTTQLYKSHPNKIIANVGMSGAGIIEEYNHYINSGRYLGASTVFLQICSFNDFMNVRPAKKVLTDYLMHYSDFLRFLLQGLKYQNTAELPLGRWAEPFSPDVKTNRDYNIFFKEDSPAKTHDLQEFNRYLGLFAGEVRRHGGRLIVFLIPTKEQVRLDWFEEVISKFHINPSELDMRRPNRFMRELAQQYSLEFVDLLEPFLRSQAHLFYQYDEHLTAQGHRLISEELTKVLPVQYAPTLLSSGFAGDRYPRYSKDGNYITFQSPRDGNIELFLADAEFRNVKRLTANNISEFHPILSPDNQAIAFTEGDPATLWTRVIIGNMGNLSDRKTITDGDSFGAIPDFSPDGRVLVCAEWHCEKTNCSNPQIVMHDLTTNERRYINDSNHESWRPVFSPDGKFLAYIGKLENQFDLFLRNLESAREDRLTKTPFDEWDPEFSPDGKFLVYSAKVNDNWDLFLFEIQNHQVTRLTSTKGDEWDASFSPEGNKIIYAGIFGLIEGVYRMDLIR
jgi:Tol biopolymer transport system component